MGVLHTAASRMHTTDTSNRFQFYYKFKILQIYKRFEHDGVFDKTRTFEAYKAHYWMQAYVLQEWEEGTEDRNSLEGMVPSSAPHQHYLLHE